MNKIIALISPLFIFLSCASVSMTGKEYWEKYSAGIHPDKFFQKEKIIKIKDIVFHDWAYPRKESLAKLNNSVSNKMLKLKMDSQSRIYHGLKFRVDLSHYYENQLHKSGPKIIGFIKYSDTFIVNKMKAQYRKKDLLTIRGYYLGVLPSSIWNKDKGQVAEDDMPVFIITNISTW